MKHTQLRSRLFAILTIFISIALIVSATLWFGNRQFGGFDMSVLIDTGYRQLLGQKPYTDFYLGTPVLFYLGSDWAYRLFGLNWEAFPKFAAVFGIVTFLLHALLLKRLQLSTAWAISLALMTQALTTVSVAYWWYNPMTAITVSLLATSGTLVLRTPGPLLHWWLYALCLFLAALSKPNSAGPMILFSSLALLIPSSTRKRALIFTAASAFAALGFLAIHGISPFRVIEFYLGVAGRGIPSMERFEDGQLPWVNRMSKVVIEITLILAAFHAYGLRKSKVRTPALLILGGCALSGVYAFFTNGEPKVTDFPMLIVPVALFILLDGKTTARRVLIPLTVFLIATGFYFGSTRYRVSRIDQFYQNPPISPVGDSIPFFQNLHSGGLLKDVLREADTLLNQRYGNQNRSHLKVLFGPRIEFSYAALGVHSPIRMPVWWHGGVSFPLTYEDRIANQFVEHDFDLCIFLKNEFTYIPAKVFKKLLSDYVRTDQEALTVFTKTQK